MKNTAKAVIGSLIGTLIASPVFANCQARIDVDGKYSINSARKEVNGEVCQTYNGEQKWQFDIDCPSHRQIIEVWLDEERGVNYLRMPGYTSRLRCPDEWMPTDNARKEMARYNARLDELYDKLGHNHGHEGGTIEQ